MARRRKKNVSNSAQWAGKSGSTPELKIRPNYTKNGVSTYVKDQEVESPTNDFEFYNRIPSITEPTTRVSFMDRAGAPIPTGPFLSSPLVSKGFMVYGLTPAFGWSDSPNSAVNEAAKKLQIYLQRTVSNKLNFDQSDTMIYCMAMAEVYSAIIFGQRILGTLNWFDPTNVYTPDGLLKAQGIDPNDARNNIAQLEYGLNNRISKLASMPVPAQMTVMQREAMKYKGYYIEGTSPKDQMYFYAPDHFYKYTEGDTGSSLELSVYDRSTSRTIAQFMAYIDTLIDAIVSNNSLREIGGVILRAFGSDQLIQLEPVPHNYVMVPSFDIVVLEQMKNATIIPSSLYDIDGLGWTQDAATALLYHNGQLVATTPAQQSQCLAIASYRILTTSTEYTDAPLIMENTRLMSVAQKATASGVWQFYTGCEFVSSCQAYVYGYSGLTATLWSQDITQYNVIDSTYASAANALNSVTVASNFKFAPAIYNVNAVSAVTDVIASLYNNQIAYDLDNYAYITPDNLKDLHDVAALSMFYIDMVTVAYK